MMKHLLLLLIVLLPTQLLFSQDNKAVTELLERVCGQSNLPLSLHITPKDGATYFNYSIQNGHLNLQASDEVALCRGFYDYAKRHNLGMFSWSGNTLSLPSQLPPCLPTEVISPFKNHYYFNVCTYGYSMPYWNWERWEREIDWMALHGINMPLALVGYEAILYRVFEKLGLTDKEINNYFVGPAHLPWMRMGNITGVDGPLNNDWHESQIALQHKILKRMRGLHMKPICPGFAGFIPKEMQRLYPELNIIETHWGGAFHNWMISPMEPLFAQISEAFISEWEKEFGTSDYYLVDSFNELDIPFPKKGDPERYQMAAEYGEKVYDAIKTANPKAVWVMQGWMFGYQRHIWDYETLQALVSKVPDDKIILLDLAVDYNKNFWHSQVNWEYYKGFFNKQWVYSVIPNMGGKVGMTGVLDFYANGHLEALKSPNKGYLIAHGLAPEGIENNEVLYELVTDAGWSNHKIDVVNWLDDYSRNRYGKYNADIETAWHHLLKSVYGTFTDHPRFNWQFRPGRVKQGSIAITDDYFKGLEAFVEAADSLQNSSFYQSDLCEMTAHYLGGKCEILLQLIDQEYLLGDTLKAHFLESRFETLMLGMDRILSQHPLLRLDRWVDFATKAGKTEQQKRQYEMNARRIISIWGPPVDDYAARIWSGMVGEYYLGRWKHYFESRTTGKAFDFAQWERQWVEQGAQEFSSPTSSFDVFSFAKKMIALSKDISADDLLLASKNVIGTWSVEANAKGELTFNLPARLLKTLSGLKLQCIKGDSKGSLQITDYEISVDGKIVFSSKIPTTMKDMKLQLKINLPADVKANNGCLLRLHYKVDSSHHLAGILIQE